MPLTALLASGKDILIKPVWESNVAYKKSSEMLSLFERVIEGLPQISTGAPK